LNIFNRMAQRAGAGAGAAQGAEARLRTAGTQARASGAAAGGAYMDRAQNFDASSYAKTAAEGAWQGISADLKRNLGELRGDQAGMGRLNTGWGQGDEDQLYTGALDRLNGELARGSFQAAGLDQANTQNLGAYGLQQAGMANDLDVAAIDRQTAAANAKAQNRTSLFGSLAGAAGTVLGGPIGGMAAKWGSQLLGVK
jgi:hypothetical protein